ncbi:MAG: metalloregulator ArsR/SmtB family transcription factor [Oscillospiraceae bacterium]|nr:metalloregulator ArsR/SmtB family transcription factor [Oscillospiraceae bacterium]
MQPKQHTCEGIIIHEDVVARVREFMPEGAQFYALSNLYKMFADSTRLKILWALSCECMCVCDLAFLLGMTKSAVSHQLKSLRLANLVRNEKQGKNVYYSLADCHVREMLENGLIHSSE